MVWAGVPAAGKGSPGTLIEDNLVATGDAAYRIERCEYPDTPAERPALRKGQKLGD